MQDAYRVTVASLNITSGSDGVPLLTPRSRLVFESLPDVAQAPEPSELLRATLPSDVLCAARAIASAVTDSQRTERADAVDAVLRAVTAAVSVKDTRTRGGADREQSMLHRFEELSELSDEQVLRTDRQAQRWG